MSKTAKENAKAQKNLKKKASGFDIMYRVITAVLAIATFPVAYFLNLVYYEVDLTALYNLFNKIQEAGDSENFLEVIKNLFTPISGSGEQAQEIVYDYISLSRLDEFKSLLNTFSSGEGVNLRNMLLNNAALRPLVISLALFAVVLVLALVIVIISIIKAKPKIVAALSGAGVILGIISNVIFTTRFANPLINGTVTLSSLVGSDSLLLSVGQSLISIESVRYENAFFTVLFLMGAILIWSLSVMIVNSGDKSEKALRDAKKAEKKAKKAKKAEKKAKKAEKKAKDKAEDAKKKAKKLLEEKENEETSAQDAEN